MLSAFLGVSNAGLDGYLLFTFQLERCIFVIVEVATVEDPVSPSGSPLGVVLVRAQPELVRWRKCDPWLGKFMKRLAPSTV